MSEVATACTIVLLRDGIDGLEVFLVKRHRRSGFMPNAWVFPGGRVEPDDADLPAGKVYGGEAAVAAFGYGARVGRAVLVGGVRETFEESGIWLGEGALPESLRQPLADGSIRLGDVLAEHDVSVDLDAVHGWARWVTPEAERRRFDTAFLVAFGAAEAHGRHDDHETVDSGWFAPRQVLDAGLEDMGLAPPTWWTLTELASMLTVADVRSSLPRRDLSPIQPMLRMADGVVGILLPGDAQHPQRQREGIPVRIVLTPMGWQAEYG